MASHKYFEDGQPIRVPYMSKKEFVDRMHELVEGAFTKRETTLAYDAFLAVLISEVEQGRIIYFPRFAKIFFGSRKGRWAKVLSEAPIYIPPMLTLKIKLLPSMRRDLNNAPIPSYLQKQKDLTIQPDCGIEDGTTQVDTTQSIK